jgi:Flp pilus assembly protein TadD
MLHWTNAKFSQAIEDLSEAIDLDRNEFSSYINRAFCLSVTKELERAAIDLTQGETLTKTNYGRGFIASNRARIAILKNDLTGALVLAEEAVSLSERPSSLCTKAAVPFLTGQLERAEQDLDKALQLDPCSAETYWWKGRLLETRGNKEEGEASKQQALEWHYTPYF